MTTSSQDPSAQTSIFDKKGNAYQLPRDFGSLRDINGGSFSASVSRTVDPDTKEQAIKRATNHANPEWKSAALDAIVEIASKQVCFTSDDVLGALDRLDVTTHDTRALGGILTAAARLKWIRKSGNYIPSKRPACHSRPILIWESLIFTQ